MTISALLSIACLFASVKAQSDSGLVVDTGQGQVRGTLSSSGVRQFLGIPFATADRWAIPQPAEKRSDIFSATTFGDSCPQDLNVGTLQFLRLIRAPNETVPEAEDCLSINIWAPTTNRTQNTAVLLWIYGGGFSFGTSNTPAYVGTDLVQSNDDILLATFNYRLNIFGSPNAPQLANGATSQNFGLLDIEAAVQWLFDNVANFGGDPERITIFGESAGSAAVDAYTFSHPNDEIVKGVIQQSGSISGRAPVGGTNTTVDPTAWNAIADIVGCGTDNIPAQFSCMQDIPFRTLEDAVIKSNASFGPVVDDKTIFSDTRARAAAGNFLKVPLLHGSNQHEYDVFLVADQLVAKGFATPVLTEIVADIMTALGFSCPAAVVAADRQRAQVPSWRYQYQAVFPEVTGRADLRAYHAAEIPLVFGAFNRSIVPPDWPALSNTIQTAWVTFARDPSQGLSNLGWPLYNPTTESLAQLGNFANSTGVTFSSGALLDRICANITTLLAVNAQLSRLF